MIVPGGDPTREPTQQEEFEQIMRGAVRRSVKDLDPNSPWPDIYKGMDVPGTPMLPGTKSWPAGNPQSSLSPDNLLMAATIMHDNAKERMRLAGDVVPIAPNIEEIKKSNLYQSAGGFLPSVPKATVEPISPTAKRNNPAFR